MVFRVFYKWVSYMWGGGGVVYGKRSQILSLIAALLYQTRGKTERSKFAFKDNSQRARAWGTSGWFERDGRTDGRKEGRMDGRKAGRKVRMLATPRSRKFSWKSVETNEANIIATVWTFFSVVEGQGR